MEVQISNLERDLTEVTTNYVALRKNESELTELKHLLLLKTEAFLAETSFQIAGDSADDQETRSKSSSDLF